MKRFALLVTLFFATAACAQSSAPPQTLNAANQCARIGAVGQATVGIQVIGTFSATLQPEVSIQGQAPQNAQVTPSTSSTPQSTITAAGAYTATVAGYNTFLVCVSDYTSGAAVVYLNATPAGSLDSLFYPGPGIANSTGTGWGPSYTPGTAAGDIPQLDLNGNLPENSIGWFFPPCTRGSCAAQAQAVLSAAAITITDNNHNTIEMDAGGVNIYDEEGDAMGVAPGSTDLVDSVSDHISLGGPPGSSANYWLSNAGATSGLISQYAAAPGDNGSATWVYGSPLFLGVGSGVIAGCNSGPGLCPDPNPGIKIQTSGISFLGSTPVSAPNACKFTTPLTLTGSPQNICSWSLPPVAETWNWKCDGIYSLTGGTLPTLILGMNASQVPTSETGSATIESTLTGTETQATVTSTSAGQVILLTGATNTQANAQFSTFGTVQASATAGTFAITAYYGGTGSPAGTVNVGTVCNLF